MATVCKLCAEMPSVLWNRHGKQNIVLQPFLTCRNLSLLFRQIRLDFRMQKTQKTETCVVCYILEGSVTHLGVRESGEGCGTLLRR